jgi:hypothetical protein
MFGGEVATAMSACEVFRRGRRYSDALLHWYTAQRDHPTIDHREQKPDPAAFGIEPQHAEYLAGLAQRDFYRLQSPLNLYLLKQRWNTGYETYDSCVVAARTEAEARAMHPSGSPRDEADRGDWAAPEHVEVTLLGTAGHAVASQPHVICASYTSG